MSTEIEIQKRCICLRSGNEIWVSEETYQKFRKAKEEAGGSILIYISELDRELNTADVVEICTPAQMDDKRRIERGERKCVYGKWHKKREVCNCFRRIKERKMAEKNREEEANMNKRKMMENIRIDLEKKGIIKPKKKTVQEIHQEETDTEIKFSDDIKYSKDGKCIVCGKPLPRNCANVCGGGCASDRDKDPEKYKDKLK